MTTFKKVMSSVLTASTALMVSGLGVASSVSAAPLTALSTNIADPRSQTSSTHVINFNVASTTAIQAMTFQYANRASGAITVPDNLDISGAAIGNITIAGDSDVTGWRITKSGGLITLDRNTTGEAAPALSSGNAVSITFNTIVNNTAAVSGGNECDTIASSESCYIRVTTYSDDSNAPVTSIDSGAVTYTVTVPTTVTATVDPSLTFTVAAVNSGNINTNDTNAACSGTNVTTTATTVPFSNLIVNTEKCGQHELSVATNALSGYTVAQKFLGAAAADNMMVGTISSSNNIDPFAASGATWGGPQVFSASPTGTAANVDSGWLGVRTYNPNGTAGGNFGTSNYYAPPAVNNTATRGNNIMTRTQTDTGATKSYFTYKIRVNAAQPADTYTGTSIYNVVPTY